jgi:putative SOS response-associated peptidase YedK
MCGRFVITSSLEETTQAFNIREVSCEYRTSWNVLPGQDIPAIVREDFNRLVCFRWGLVPFWAKDPSMGRKLINARAETIAEKPSFRHAFAKRRCLIVANGFYEWLRQDTRKIPVYFSVVSGKPFGFAGLYESWTSAKAERIDSCTIITTAANELVMPVHDRMPVIVPKERESLWLDPTHLDRSELLSILRPYPPEDMTMEEVSPRVFRQ